MEPKIAVGVAEVTGSEENMLELGSLELALVGGGIGETTL